MFGALNLLNAIFVLLFIKETKGVSLEVIPDLFGERLDESLEAEPWPGAYGKAKARERQKRLGIWLVNGGDELGLILLDVK